MRQIIQSYRCPINLVLFGSVLVCTTFFATGAVVESGAVAQPPGDKKDAQSTVEPRSKPGAGQTFLQQFVGEWDVVKTFHPRGNGQPSRTTGRCKQTMIHDGRFLQSEFVFGEGSSKSTGLGLIGFEPATGRFTSIWTDSRQTQMSFRQSREPFNGTQIVLFGQSLGTDQPSRQSKTITHTEDNARKLIHRQYSIGTDVPERLVMELVMTRNDKSTNTNGK